MAECEIKVAVVERPGPKWKDTMMMTNTTERPECQQKDKCLICNTDKGGNCRKKEIVYELNCPKCQDGYDGQTGRNGLTRGKEHVEKSKSKDPKQ